MKHPHTRRGSLVKPVRQAVWMRTCACAIVVLSLLWGPCASGQLTLQREIAKRYYRLGEKLYEASDYPAALAKFQEAYKLAPMPVMLYNIARCHEVMADLEPAIKFYEQYLETLPGAKNRDLVQSRLVNLKVRLAARKLKPPEPAKPPARAAPASSPVRQPAASRPVTPPEDGPEPRHRWKRTAGWVVVGVGAASLATGFVMGGLAQGKANEYTEAAGPDQKRPYDDLQEIRSSGESLQTAQIVTLIIGGVAVAAGGGLLLWDHLGQRKNDAGTSAMVLPYLTSGGGGLAGQLEF